MKTFALSQGDLVVGQAGHATISGAAKIRQELALDLGEEFGTDRFHPDQWGSTVLKFIGEPVTPSLEAAVRSEVARTVSQYIAIQDQEIYSGFIDGTRSRFGAGDVVRTISRLDVTVDRSSIFISLGLVTLSGQSIDINRTVAL